MTDKSDLDDEVVQALKAGRKIKAIKLLRDAEGIGLKEAKERVEAYADRHGLTSGSGSDSNPVALLVGIMAGLVAIAAISARVLF